MVLKSNLLTAARFINRFSDSSEQPGDRIGWEYHNVTLSRVPGYGFGIAISGGRDNPHFVHGDPSIAISDVLKAGPAEGRLQVNDRVVSANGISLENVDYSMAVQVLRECGSQVNLLVKRKIFMPPSSDVIKVSLSKNKKKDDFGIVLGCKIYIKEISNKNFIDKEASLQEGDVLLKINSTSLDNMTLKEAKKLIDACKDKLQLTVKRENNLIINNNCLTNNNNRHGSNNLNGDSPRYSIYENGSAHLANRNAMKDSLLNSSSFPPTGLWSTVNQNVYVQPPTRHVSGQQQQQQQQQQGMNQGNNLSQVHQPPPPPTQSSGQNVSHGMPPPPPNQGTPVGTANLSRHPSSSGGGLASRTNRPPPLEIPTYLPPPPPPPPLHVMPSLGNNTNGDALNSSNRPGQYANDLSDVTPMKVSRSRRSTANSISSDPRVVSFKKEGSVGIRLTGGNEVGIFVTGVQPGSPAAVQGLQPGDKILKVNSTDLKGFTREDAVMYLLSAQDQVDLLVQHKKSEYESIISGLKGDSFHVKTHFDFVSSTKGELSFHANEVFHVTDTLFNGAVGSWSVHRLGRNNQEIQKGTIPNRSRAEQLASDQAADKIKRAEASEGRSSFFRRRSARRSKSFSRDRSHHRWQDSLDGLLSTKFPAYERVSLKHPGFIRPLVIFGPLADIAREKLMKEYPDKYAVPQVEPNGDGAEGEVPSKSSSSKPQGIFRLSSIREIIDKGKHALLDITPQAVERLNYAQFYPIVIFMRAENKTIVKELRARHTKIGGTASGTYSTSTSASSSASNVRQKSSRKLFERNVKLEKHWPHVFTSTIALTGADMWYKKLRETIERQQQQNIWVAETKPDEIISDDFLFPMTSRLSYASSPESDLDMTLDSCKDDDDDEDRKDPSLFSKSRLVRASSDPSIATVDDDAPSASGVNSSRTHHRQIPLHIMLRKELSRALKRDSKVEKASSSTSGGVVSSLGPTEETATASVNKNRKPSKEEEADAEEYYGTPAKDFAGLFPNERYPLPPAPPMTSPPKRMNGRRDSSSPSTPEKKNPYRSPPPSLTNSPSKSIRSSVSTAVPFNPPRIDRAKKPERFKSAHERLFGKKTEDVDENGQNGVNGDGTPNGSKRDSNRDSMASPEYMNSSSFSVPPPPPVTTSPYVSYSSKNVTSFASHHQATVSTLSSDHSSSNSTTPYQRTKYQSFLSDLIRTQKDPPPPPPPKPSSVVSNSYQPIYSPQGHRLSNRLSTSNAFPANVSSSVSPSGIGSSSLFPPPPPPSPPKSLVNNHHNSSSVWRESDATYATAIPASCRPSRLPPPSAQDLLSRRPLDSDAEVSEILSRKSNYDIRSQY